ncbi:M14 family metallopeptidase [Roseateles chitosanitabidus]|uniref:M14 family metallopeptidase n=1 Tax=Roseateles chitosanitabidus TaxID=65048 RepID=UPI002352555F|nr:M14 family metallopeptidase [Roseateles chitosanitabidus]
MSTTTTTMTAAAMPATSTSDLDLSVFSSSYVEARDKFLAATARLGLTVRSYLHPLEGRDGERLALDLVRVGREDASNLLVVSSGCHGIEGFCGSAVQIDLLRDAAFQRACDRDDLAVLYLHALNPHGFSWERRVTHENVDLNRNFRDFGRPWSEDLDYLAIAHLLLPERCPPTLGSSLGLTWKALTRGRKAIQAAISRGQQVDPKGLFFAGHGPTWSNLQLRAILREQAQRCRRIGWIDIHTGLGPMGVGERIYKGRTDAASIARARRWWGHDVTSSEEGNSSSSVLGGTLDQGVMQECPQAEYNGLTLEYGTLPGRAVLDALRRDHWLENHPETDDETRRDIKRALRAAFYVETDEWKRQVLTQARVVLAQTLVGLASPLDR